MAHLPHPNSIPVPDITVITCLVGNIPGCTCDSFLTETTCWLLASEYSWTSFPPAAPGVLIRESTWLEWSEWWEKHSKINQRNSKRYHLVGHYRIWWKAPLSFWVKDITILQIVTAPRVSIISVVIYWKDYPGWYAVYKLKLGDDRSKKTRKKVMKVKDEVGWTR